MTSRCISNCYGIRDLAHPAACRQVVATQVTEAGDFNDVNLIAIDIDVKKFQKVSRLKKKENI